MAAKNKNKTALVVREPSKELLELSNQVAMVIGTNPIKEIFEIGNRVNALAQLLAHPDVSNILEKLEGSPAGFMTDMKDGKKYDAKTRANAVMDCLSQGAKCVHNEINIIRGRGMLVKNFYHRMLDILGHENSPSHACIYQMENWYHKEVLKDKGQGIITFDCSVSGTWVKKSTGEIEKFDWNTEVSVKFGGQYDTIDKAQGQVQRRAWKEFYERWGGVRTDDPEVEFDSKAIEPKITGNEISEGLPETKPEVEDAEVIEPEPAKDIAPEPNTQVPEEASVPEEKPITEDTPPTEAQQELLSEEPEEGDLF